MAFDFVDDMDSIFLQSGFEEDITYAANGGSAVAMRAIVDRSEASFVRKQGANQGQFQSYKTTVSVSKTNVPTVTRNADVVTLSRNGISETYRVGGVIEEDQGAYTLGLI